MKINLSGLKVSDIIDSSKSRASEGTQVPPLPETNNQNTTNPKYTVDTTQSDSLGSKSMDYQSQASDASQPSKTKGINPAGKGIAYDAVESKAADQAKPGQDANDIASTTAPKQRSFKQALMDKMVSDSWDKTSDSTPTAKQAPIDSTGPNQTEHAPPQIDAPGTKRPQVSQFDPRSINRPPDPNPPGVDPDAMRSKVKPPTLNLPNIKMPNIRPNFR